MGKKTTFHQCCHAIHEKQRVFYVTVKKNRAYKVFLSFFFFFLYHEITACNAINR